MSPQLLTVHVNAMFSVCFVDSNEFVRQSGWFSHHGLAHGKIALQHVIAKKAGLSYESFVSIQQAVYHFNYRHGEKVGVSFEGTFIDFSLCFTLLN